MNDNNLINFCVTQKENFNLSDWENYPIHSNIRVAALVLSCLDWYGKKQELGELCNKWSMVKSDIPILLESSKFDVAGFISTLDYIYA